MIKAVVFDLGGVVFDSPVVAIAKYAKELGLPSAFFGQVIKQNGVTGSFAKFERGEIGPSQFASEFEEGTSLDIFIPVHCLECKASGATICGKKFVSLLFGVKLRPAWVEAIRQLREAGYKTATITNDFLYFDNPAEEAIRREGNRLLRIFSNLLHRTDKNFQGVVWCNYQVLWSWNKKTRPGDIQVNPFPFFFTEINRMAVSQLGVKFSECIYLDDLGDNLKPAKDLVFSFIGCLLTF